LSQAIGRGSLVRSGAVLETLSRVRMMIFDKTGTLTAGRPSAVEFVASATAERDPEEPLRLAAALEQEVTHPFARALVESARTQGRRLPSPSEVRVTPGAGAQGVVDGHHLVVGKLSWLASAGIVGLPVTSADSSRSGLAIGIDGRYAGEVLVDDPPRPEARSALAELDRMGITCHLVSGDRHDVVASVAKAVGILKFASNQSPTDKPLTIRALGRGSGLAAMVGDGVNDAPALAAADAGIAFGPAADLARETADVTILREDLLEIPRLLALARKTFRIVRQNLAWAFAYNSVAVLIAALGLLRPVYAAAAMVLSSVCVVANSMRLGKGDGRR
jgi:P-type E1-E2 ATPase